MRHARTTVTAAAALLLATAAPALAGTGCLGDTNGDGDVNVDDIVNVVLDFGSDGSTNGGDVNGDGITDVDDIVVVVLAFGPCPQPACPTISYLATSPEQPTFIDFASPDAPPIPADFFHPGSLPFEGPIEFRGLELDPDLPFIDTHIARADPFDHVDLPVGHESTVDIQLVELSLVGMQPFQVQTQDGPEQWMLSMGLAGDQPPGQMTAIKTHPDGGLFTSTLLVQPIFAFARLDDLVQLADGLIAPEDVDLRILDYDLEGLPPVDMGWSTPMPYSTQPPGDGGFFCPDETFFMGVDSSGAGGPAGMAPSPMCGGWFGSAGGHCAIAPAPKPPLQYIYDALGFVACIDYGDLDVVCADGSCAQYTFPTELRLNVPAPPGPPTGAPPFLVVPIASDTPGCASIAYYQLAGVGP